MTAQSRKARRTSATGQRIEALGCGIRRGRGRRIRIDLGAGFILLLALQFLFLFLLLCQFLLALFKLKIRFCQCVILSTKFVQILKNEKSGSFPSGLWRL